MSPRIVQHFISEIVDELEQNQLTEEEEDEAQLNDIAENLVLFDQVQQHLVAEIASLRSQIQAFNEETDQLRADLREFLVDSQQLRTRMQEVMRGVEKTD
jgi:hypothetical protein